jgi:hypothetical protein|nr:hypothetical protein [Chlorobaculum tepidum]
MLWAERFFADSECVSNQRFSVGVSSRFPEYSCTGIEIERVFVFDGGGFFVVSFGFGVVDLQFVVPALQIIHLCKVLAQIVVFVAELREQAADFVVVEVVSGGFDFWNQGFQLCANGALLNSFCASASACTTLSR